MPIPESESSTTFARRAGSTPTALVAVVPHPPAQVAVSAGREDMDVENRSDTLRGCGRIRENSEDTQHRVFPASGRQVSSF